MKLPEHFASAYDSSGQVTGSSGDINTTYGFDSGGNRNTTGYTTGRGNEMTASPGYTYTYDNAGNTISKTQTSTGNVWTYSYDYHNRMTAAVEKNSGGTTLAQVSYTYDALGRQINSNVSGGSNTWTVFNGSGADANPYADYTGAGALSVRYLYAPAVDAILARTSATAVTAWYLTDQLGSVRFIEDTSANLLDAIKYDPFGNIVSESNAANGDRFKFTAREYDTTTGLYYYRARYYDPSTGRFVTQDPKGFTAGDPNLYRYVSNLPTMDTDPSGLHPVGLKPNGQMIRPALPPPAPPKPPGGGWGGFWGGVGGFVGATGLYVGGAVVVVGGAVIITPPVAVGIIGVGLVGAMVGSSTGYGKDPLLAWGLGLFEGGIVGVTAGKLKPIKALPVRYNPQPGGSPIPPPHFW